MAATPYGPFTDHLAQKRIDIDTDVIKVALVGAGYTANYDTHDFFNDITNEITGTGYTAGGATLASVTWTYNTTTNKWTFDSADPSWTGAVFTPAPRGAVVYMSTGTAATSPLICHYDFGSDQPSGGGPYTLNVNGSGWFSIG